MGWRQLGRDIDGEAAGDGEAGGDYSGVSVSLNHDGTIVAIGAFENDGASGTDRGHVRIYRYNGAAWRQLGRDIDGEAGTQGQIVGDQSGYSVSLNHDGTIVAIGALNNDGASGEDRGHVRIYKYI